MRPRLITPRNILLFLIACCVAGGLFYWRSIGAPLPFTAGVPSTAGKIVFVSDRNGHKDLWMMDGASGENAVALTDDEAEDRQPSFAPDGKTIVFTSANRSGVSPQIYSLDAAPGRRPFRLTSTSGAKDSPVFAEGGHVAFLDTGKLLEIGMDGQNPHTVFPEADLKKALTDFLSSGGLDSFARSQKAERFALVMNAEAGQSLLLYQFNEDEPSSLILALLGQGKRIQVHSLENGGFVAAFEGGGPLTQPGLILSHDLYQAMTEERIPMPPQLNVRPQEGINVFARFSAEGQVEGIAPLHDIVPFAPGDVVTAPDGNFVAMTVEEEEAGAGVYVLNFGETGTIKRVFDKPSREPAFSPDGKSLAFVSGKDIFLVPIDGSSPPKNLTGGKGQNFAPTWSPARPEAKK